MHVALYCGIHNYVQGQMQCDNSTVTVHFTIMGTDVEDVTHSEYIHFSYSVSSEFPKYLSILHLVQLWCTDLHDVVSHCDTYIVVVSS